jgi:hypothetical protein
MLRLILTDTEMGLFLILIWRAAAMGLCGGSNIFPDHSRFSEFNSRLGGFKFPVRPATGIDWQMADLPRVFCGQRAVMRAKSRKFPDQRELTGTRPYAG